MHEGVHELVCEDQGEGNGVRERGRKRVGGEK